MPRHRMSLAALVLLLVTAPPALAAGGPGAAAWSDGSAWKARPDTSDPAAPGRDYIVVFHDSADVTLKVSGFAHSLAVRARHTYRHAFKGFSASLTPAQYRKVAADTSVEYIVPDQPIHAEGQVVPTGVARVGAIADTPASIGGVDNRVDADIAIVDTGIQKDHPDLNVAGGYSCASDNPRAWGDIYGHGTHVAGTAAALDNGIGVVGVAPGARLWSVKVFDNAGNGKISWYACGLDWIASQRDPADPTRPLIEVANMSLRTVGRNDNACGSINHDPLHRAICRAVALGTTVVVAAGNDHTDARYWVPASYPEVITVSALADFNGAPGGAAPSTCSSWGSPDRDDTFANFSNYGWVVDMMASGKCIYSTFPGGSYKVMSGTSMATPAVTGAVALWKSLHPDASPATVKAVLRAAGRFDWAFWTDPDPYHERMLNVSSFGQGEDFAIDFSSVGQVVGAAGGIARYTVQLTRNDAFTGKVDLTAGDLPPGGAASFSPDSLQGLGGLSSTLSITVPPGLPEGSYYPLVTGTAGEKVRNNRMRLTVDLTPPEPRAPTARLAAGTVGQSRVPLVVNWGASDPAGIGGYELQQSTDGGAYQTVGSYSGSLIRVGRSVASGHSYRFRIRARDRVGNLSEWAPGTSFRVGRVEQTSGAVTYRGIWRSLRASYASGGSFRYTGRFRATATLKFIGRQVSWISSVGPTSGSAKLYINGEYVKTVSLYSRTTSYRRIAFLRIYTTSAARTLTVWVAATAGHPRVDVDAFVVLR